MLTMREGRIRSPSTIGIGLVFTGITVFDVVFFWRIPFVAVAFGLVGGLMSLGTMALGLNGRVATDAASRGSGPNADLT